MEEKEKRKMVDEEEKEEEEEFLLFSLKMSILFGRFKFPLQSSPKPHVARFVDTSSRLKRRLQLRCTAAMQASVTGSRSLPLPSVSFSLTPPSRYLSGESEINGGGRVTEEGRIEDEAERPRIMRKRWWKDSRYILPLMDRWPLSQGMK